MLLDFNSILLKYKIYPKSVISVGAHFGEEYNSYLTAGIKKIVFVEPCRMAFDELKRRFQYAPNVKLFNVALGERAEVNVKMFTSDNAVNKGQSNSLLRPDKHLQIHPEISFDGSELVAMERLDDMDLPNWVFDMLVMDCQGYEGNVLRGGLRRLNNIDYVYTEVNKASVYENCTMVGEIDEILSDFQRVETGTWVGNAWTDAFYIRKTLLL